MKTAAFDPSQTASARRAPELAVSQWFNSPTPLTLAALRGRPIFLHSFQLLCPGCVAQSIPQAQRIERVFAGSDLQVIGMHTVFEHHAAMMPVTLAAFLHEYRIRHPVGIDAAAPGSDIPVTMDRYGWRGTPSSVLVGRDGTILQEAFGVEDDIAVGARIAMALLASPEAPATDDDIQCRDGRCEAPASAGGT